jgi:hypothetical protein
MKRTGQRRKRNKLKLLNPELEGHKVKFQHKKLLDQQKEIDEQWERIKKLQSLDMDL